MTSVTWGTTAGLTALADGTYTLEVRGENGAGNGPAVALSNPVVLDTVSVTSLSLQGGMPTQGVTATKTLRTNKTLTGATITKVQVLDNSDSSVMQEITSGFTIVGTDVQFNMTIPNVLAMKLRLVGTLLSGSAIDKTTPTIAINSIPTADTFTAPDNGGNASQDIDFSSYVHDAQDPAADLTFEVTENPDGFTVDASNWPIVTVTAPA